MVPGSRRRESRLLSDLAQARFSPRDPVYKPAGGREVGSFTCPCALSAVPVSPVDMSFVVHATIGPYRDRPRAKKPGLSRAVCGIEHAPR